MPMKQKLYKIIAYEIDGEIDAEGVTATMTRAASYVTEAVTPWDAAMAWGAKLEAEDAS